MKRVSGYVISVVGLVVMSIGFNIVVLDWEIFNLIPLSYLSGIGLALVGVGVIVALMGNKGSGKRKGGEEVPIYEGTGKRRRVVGYRRD